MKMKLVTRERVTLAGYMFGATIHTVKIAESGRGVETRRVLSVTIRYIQHCHYGRID